MRERLSLLYTKSYTTLRHSKISTTLVTGINKLNILNLLITLCKIYVSVIFSVWRHIQRSYHISYDHNMNVFIEYLAKGYK